MAEQWFERLIAAVRADGRGMRTLSLAAKCGPNYIQQMIKDGKRPSVDKLLSILDALGQYKAFEILTGVSIPKEDFELIHLMNQIDAPAKQAAASFFRAFLDQQQMQSLKSNSEGR